VKLEFKLIDGSVIYGDEDIFKKIGDNFGNNKLTTSSLLNVVCAKTKVEYIFSMTNVIYIKVISEIPEGFTYG
jgi:hypothetical protein